ncbi:NAD-dependent epimerase/dehydratase family protein [Thioflexithrix psekupsensis]|uniref:NAD-dependent dehydratase n=1 Tax=Thioflexithrix psekupsensis TaxID=1570016 RepID=A0A251XA98_9GAMM|nr:NAD(P)-dependent oxidoreductase [Thioflexithrix psekupsensis]OUD14958.1 NAD-dependent dehydratase [Thioflexithrix psekupsensis]
MNSKKIILPGGAGLVGQNVVVYLKQQGYHHIVVLDKHRNNLEIMRRLHPDIVIEYADLAESGAWEQHFADAAAVVMLQAQIGGLESEVFFRNNVTSTECVLAAMHQYHVPFLVHISSSVVMSLACDDYTETKKIQEDRVKSSGIEHVILRPTLMFGWFDRKHLGWLSRFMQKVPLFPIPGNGKYMRQPLYVGDFAHIIIRCLENPIKNETFNISGLERIDYIDMIRVIKKTIHAKSHIIKIPYSLFYFLLYTWGLFDKDPPFTVKQLKALVTHDEFEVIDWPSIFNVTPTPFAQAVAQTFCHPEFSHVILEF